MTGLTRLRHLLSKIADAMLYMGAGAWLLVCYLEQADLSSRDQLDSIKSNLFIACLTLLTIGNLLRSQTRGEGHGPEISPRWSGVSVVVVTGLVAMVAVANDPTRRGYVAAAAIALVTLIVAVLVWRFATAHADEIGEARFVPAKQSSSDC